MAKGLYSLTAGPGPNPIENSVLANPAVDGISIAMRAHDVEATQGDYDYTFLDTELARITLAGKEGLIRIGTGGGYEADGGDLPDFLSAIVGANTFSFKNDDGDTVTIPLWWYQPFLDWKIAMIEDAGAHFSGNNTIKVFACNFANGSHEDWGVLTNLAVDGVPPGGSTQVTRLLTAGYTHALMLGAATQIIDAAMAAFPQAVIYMALGKVRSSALEPTGADALSEDVLSYARSEYGDRFILGRNIFSAKIGAGQLMLANPPYAGQALGKCYNDTTNKMLGGSNPEQLTEEEVFKAMIDLAKGVEWLEAWEADTKNLPSSALNYGHAVLIQEEEPEEAPGVSGGVSTVRKTALEYAAQSYLIELFRTHSALSGKTFRHFDEDRPAESNCITVRAQQGALLRANEPGTHDDDPPVLRDSNGAAVDAYEVEVNITYRAPSTSTTRQNDLIAQALTDAVTSARTNQTTSERKLRYLVIRNAMTSNRSNTKSLRRLEKTFNLIAALK